jgi:NADH dehydrogenase
MSDLDVVTGAFSYTGRFVADRLLRRGRRLRTLTNHPDPSSPNAAHIETFPLDFSNTETLGRALRDADTLYNTYWVRSNQGAASFAQAVANTRVLLAAAQSAGVRRIVHVSIANPTAVDLPYYRGKAELETAVRECGISYAIVRPTLLFGQGDVLVNNIAWFLRHLPVFGVPGNGRYRLQPVYVEDYADLLVEAGSRSGNVVMDAAGPDSLTFSELVHTIRDGIGARALVITVPPAAVLLAGRLAGMIVRDIPLTGDEVRGLMAGVLASTEPPRGRTSLRTWIRTEAATLGTRYASEADRHYRAPAATAATGGVRP